MGKPISTTIRVNDRASAALNNISRNLGKCISGFMRLNTVSEGTFNVGTFNSCDDVLESINKNVNRIADSMDEATVAADGFNDNINGAYAGTNKLLSTVRRVAGAYITMQGIGSVIDTSDTIAMAQQRLALVVREGETVDEMNKKIMASANSARASYTDTFNQVSKLAMNAGKSFDSTDQIVKFVEQFNKLGIMGGASVYESSQAMYQLTQSMAKGKLDGDELRSVMEGMPLVAQEIAQYLGTDVGTMKELAAEGAVTAEVVRNALLGAAAETDDAFGKLDFTWAQRWQIFKNNAIQAFQPVLERINQLANNTKMQAFIVGLQNSMYILSAAIIGLFDVVGAIFGFIYDNFSWLFPLLSGVVGIMLVYLAVTKGIAFAQAVGTAIMGAFRAVQTFVSIGFGVLTGNTAAASAAMFTYNSALLACPLTWILIIIIAVIAAIYAIVGAINKLTGSSISATGIIAGVFATLGAHIINTFVIPLQNMFASFVNFLDNVFNDPVAAIQVLFYDMALTVIGYISNMATAIEKVINKIPGVEVDITSGLDGFQTKLEKMQAKVKNESEWVETIGKWDYIDYESAANAGYAFGEGIGDKVGDLFSQGANTTFEYTPDDSVLSSLGTIEDNTGTTAKSVDISSEDLKYLRDIAEQEAINRFTTAKITVEMNNQNTVNSNMDLDGIVDHLATRVTEAMEVVAAGAY